MNNKKSDPTIRNLYPHLTDEELVEAEASLNEYLDFVLILYERIGQDPEAYSRFQKQLEVKRLLRTLRKRIVLLLR